MSDIPPDPDLSLVETEHLIDEIFRRNDAVVVLMLQHRTNDRSMIETKYKGGVATCVGMAEIFKADLLNDWVSPDEDGEDSNRD